MEYGRRDTYKTQSVRVWMTRDVSRQVDIRHPTRDELDGIGGDTQEGDDVRVRQVFPRDGHLVEGLGMFLAFKHVGKCHQNAPS